jgi:hypothetical protein
MVCYLYTAALSRLKKHRSWVEKNSTRRFSLASFRKDLEKPPGEGIPSLEDLESGKLAGAVLPMSEQAQTQMRNSIEVIDYLLNQERVIWS